MHWESSYQENTNKIRRQSIPGREKVVSKGLGEKGLARPSSPQQKDVAWGMPVILCKKAGGPQERKATWSCIVCSRAMADCQARAQGPHSTDGTRLRSLCSEPCNTGQVTYRL